MTARSFSPRSSHAAHEDRRRLQSLARRFRTCRAVPVDHAEEFDSPETIDAICRVLEGAGHTTARLGYGRPLLSRLLDDPPDLVFNNIAEGLHGRSREAQVPAACEMLGIPYTGSDPLTLALTLDKDLAKRVVASHGLATRGTCSSSGSRRSPAERIRGGSPFPSS